MLSSPAGGRRGGALWASQLLRRSDRAGKERVLGHSRLMAELRVWGNARQEKLRHLPTTVNMTRVNGDTTRANMNTENLVSWINKVGAAEVEVACVAFVHDGVGGRFGTLRLKMAYGALHPFQPPIRLAVWKEGKGALSAVGQCRLTPGFHG